MNHPLKLVSLTLLAACMAAGQCFATPANAVFHVDQATSSLKITAKPPVFGAESDTQQLTGTINATFDFGNSGGFPATANVTVTSSDVEPAGDYDFSFGFPPAFGFLVNASGLVANTTTITPPGTMIKAPPAIPGAYQFDASQFDIALNQGVITVTGAVNDTVDLSEEPVSGSSPMGTTGTIVFTVGGTSGPYTLINAALTLPIDIDRTVPFGDPPQTQNVDMQLDGTVKGTASFYAALSGVNGDFDNDADVDADDLVLWQTGFGKQTGAVLGDGDADVDGDVDGKDFLVWQNNRGLKPPGPGAVAAPEPTTAALIIAALFSSALRRRSGR